MLRYDPIILPSDLMLPYAVNASCSTMRVPAAFV